MWNIQNEVTFYLLGEHLTHKSKRRWEIRYDVRTIFIAGASFMTRFAR